MSAPFAVRAQINTDQMMTVGRNALYFEDYVLSIQYFNQVIDAKPFLHEPYFYRGVAKLSLEDYSGAESDCSKSISLNPFVVNSYQVRGLARIYQEKYAEAVDDYRQALRWDPENRSIRHNLILCLMRMGHDEEAWSAADTLMAIWPKYTPGMAMQAQMMMEKGDTAQALANMDKAVSTDKYDPSLYQDRARILLAMKEYADAETDMEQAVHLEPDNASLYVTRALIRYYRNNLRGAMNDYDLAVELRPSDILAHYNRGLLRSQVGDDNRAIEDFDYVIEAEPDNMLAVFNRAILRDKTGDLAGAVQDYTTVLAEYPDFIQGYEMRSEARYQMGDLAGAEQDQMRVIRDRTSRFNSAQGYGSGDDDDVSESEDKTREQSDRNVHKYRRIVVPVSEHEASSFTSEYRGKVQDRNVDVQFHGQFFMTYFDNSRIAEVDRNIRFSSAIDGLNSQGVLPFSIKLTDSDIHLTENQINSLFQDLDRQTENIYGNPDEPMFLFARAMDFYMLQDLENAENDFSMAIATGGDLWAVYFCRSNVRMRQLEMKLAERPADLQSGTDENGSMKYVMDYQLVTADLDKVIDIEPDFAYAYYNRGCVSAILGDYRAAVYDFDKAIGADPSIAEAWFNRGIANIFLGNVEDGLDDLRHAGEMGVYQSYNIMKRFSNQ